MLDAANTARWVGWASGAPILVLFWRVCAAVEVVSRSRATVICFWWWPIGLSQGWFVRMCQATCLAG